MLVRTILILMMLTSQIIAGMGGSVYLCISSQGINLDAGPSACTSCDSVDDHKTPERHPTCLKSDHHSSCGCGETPFSHGLANDVASIDDSCDCLHILVTESSNVPATVTSSTAEIEFRITISDAAILSQSQLDSSRFVQNVVASPRHQVVFDSTLSILSNVIIRC